MIVGIIAALPYVAFGIIILLLIWDCLRTAIREHDSIRKDAENEK